MKTIDFHDYQIEAIAFAFERDGAAIFADPGLGKTAIALAAIDYHRALFGGSALVIAPLRPLLSTWPSEIENWSNFRHLRYQILHGNDREIRPGKDVYLVNPEGLDNVLRQKAARKISYLIIDESSKFKNPSAKRTKLVKQYVRHVPKRMILSGTPAPNSMLDLFSQIYILDRGATFGGSFHRFKETFFYSDDYNQWTWKPKEGAEQKINELIAPIALRLDGEKLLELPDFVHRNFAVELPPNRREEYNKIERKLFAEIDSEKGKLNFVSDDSSYGLCRQFTSGFAYRKTLPGGDGKPVIEGEKTWIETEARERKIAQNEGRKMKFGRAVISIHNEKVRALREIVDELQGKPVMVVYNYVFERDLICKEFGDLPCIGRNTSPAQGQEIVKQWNSDEIPILLVHPQSAAHGLNLQRGSGRHVIWFSLTDNLENYQQMNRRIRRQGVDSKVFIYHLITKASIDEAIMARLKIKDKTQAAMLSALEEYRHANRS